MEPQGREAVWQAFGDTVKLDLASGTVTSSRGEERVPGASSSGHVTVTKVDGTWLLLGTTTGEVRVLGRGPDNRFTVAVSWRAPDGSAIVDVTPDSWVVRTTTASWSVPACPLCAIDDTATLAELPRRVQVCISRDMTTLISADRIRDMGLRLCEETP